MAEISIDEDSYSIAANNKKRLLATEGAEFTEKNHGNRRLHGLHGFLVGAHGCAPENHETTTRTLEPQINTDERGQT